MSTKQSLRINWNRSRDLFQPIACFVWYTSALCRSALFEFGVEMFLMRLACALLYVGCLDTVGIACVVHINVMINVSIVLNFLWSVWCDYPGTHIHHFQSYNGYSTLNLDFIYTIAPAGVRFSESRRYSFSLFVNFPEFFFYIIGNYIMLNIWLYFISEKCTWNLIWSGSFEHITKLRRISSNFVNLDHYVYNSNVHVRVGWNLFSIFKLLVTMRRIRVHSIEGTGN